DYEKIPLMAASILRGDYRRLSIVEHLASEAQPIPALHEAPPLRRQLRPLRQARELRQPRIAAQSRCVGCG
ncbi:hypothetical protein, partial [Stenotrophomonas sp.]|uniref:hypothetical protein n=1 Tax=Stenotrophomonas sp. TaxID=69392 RepID=UPI0028AFED6B